MQCLKRVAYCSPHDWPARLQLVEQVHPVGQAWIGAKAFALLGTGLVGASEIAQELGAKARWECLERFGEVGCVAHDQAG